MHTLSHCPVCNSEKLKNAFSCVDHTTTQETFQVQTCNQCSFTLTNPRPNDDQLGKYYESNDYISHSNNQKGIFNRIYQMVRYHAMESKFKLINGLNSNGLVLDYGCGTGEFLQEAKRQQWTVRGIEPSEKARAQAIGKLPAEVLGTLAEVPEQEAYDVVTLFHVLEHIHSLRKTVKKIASHLKSNGYLVIAVPNPESADAKHYGKDWAGYDVPRHLYHFSEKSMNIFQSEFGMELVRVEPLTYDSYYVSLLSEGYKNPNSGLFSRYLNAFLQGYKSNQKAGKPGQYSSNIFIFKKK